MKKTRLILLLILTVSFWNTECLMAQTVSEGNQNPFSISLDLMSRYVWRGTDFGHSPSIQPGIELNKGGFTLGAWAAYATNQTATQETDLYVGYTYKKFSFTLTDYFFPNEVSDYNYFEYNKDKTGHLFEASIAFDGGEQLPLTILLATNIYGADNQRINAQGAPDGIQYSTYAELAYNFKYFNLFMGANLTSVHEERGESGFYGNAIGIVNLGITASQDVTFAKNFSLPLTFSLITNPQAGKVYFVAGISL